MTVNKLGDIIDFREDRLFDGAVDLEWLTKDKPKATLAAQSFVFHGPSYHGVTQEDVGISNEHRLIDTATFTQKIVRRCCGLEDQPFTLAIAGYGTGKSHLAITLATLLSDPDSITSKEILNNIALADVEIGEKVRQAVKELRSPALVIAINGMGNFDLASEFTRQAMVRLRERGIDSKALEELRPRFKMACNLVQFMPSGEANDLANQIGISNKADLLNKLLEYDEIIYGKVSEYFAGKGIQITALGDETVKNVLETICKEYCGEDKPFSSVIVLFDEFGRYAEFATYRSQIAGSGVLQHLFEGIQSNAPKAMFVGFIQFDLNTYVQRVGQEYRNEILRVTTRYQSADKAYLSINLETLIANLLEKKNPMLLAEQFDNEVALNQSNNISRKLISWFPKAAIHRLWTDGNLFHQIIRKGCWPLSPYATWFLYHLAAGGQHLQQRSALSLLGSAYRKYQEQKIHNLNWEMSAVDLWSDQLQIELITGEESGNLGTITLSYANVMARNEQSFSDNEKSLLRAIVIGAKLGLSAADRNSSVSALSALSGMPILDTGKAISKLEEEYNVITWDQSFKQFEILGDTASRPAFLAFIHQRTSVYDTHKKSQLFVRRGQEWGSEILIDQSCDFAENNAITTNEWRYEHLITNLDELRQAVNIAAQNWETAYAVDRARGTIIYCYLESEHDLENLNFEISKLLKGKSKELKEKALPILVVLIHDEEGFLGKCMAELDVLDQLNEQEKARFGNLIGSHRQKNIELFLSQIDALIKKRNYVTALPNLENARLSVVGGSIFKNIYSKILSFPFDGFSTAKGNAADSCMSFTSELLNGVLDFQTVSGKSIKEKNRAIQVLKNAWNIFNADGQISRRPGYEIARSIINEWQDQIKEKNGFLNLANALKTACKPPYGANIASAGLLLGVFFRPRKDSLSVVLDGQLTDFPKLISDGLFRGKFLDLNKLDKVNFIPAENDGKSEWDILLDEWEQAASAGYNQMIEIWTKAQDLKTRIAIPSSQAYRYELYVSKSAAAKRILEDVGIKIDDAMQDIERGEKSGDLRVLTYGGANLKEIQDRMCADFLWDSKEAHHYEQNIENVRQRTIQMFDTWISSRHPNGPTINDASEFQRKYKIETGKNLQKLGLDDLYDKLCLHVDSVIKKIELVAQANELINKIGLWVSSNEIMQPFRVAQLRTQREMAKDYSQKLTEMSKKIPSMLELNDVKNQLSLYIQNNKNREKEIEKRASILWDIHFSVEGIDSILDEVGDLELAYENCDDDIQDLRLMRRSLHFYRDAFIQLSPETLTESEFESLAKSLEEKGINDLAKEKPPWIPEETIPIIVKNVQNSRKQKGEKWITEVEPLTEGLNKMDITQANDLFNKLVDPPSFLSALQKRHVLKLLTKVENRLNEVKIDWLVKRYEELDNTLQKKFLQLIGVGSNR